MSSGRRATRPMRQLSLQQPTPRRQHIRRQRSAEDDCGKSLQIYANPIARNRLVNATEKPKVRVAWGNDHRGDGLAQVEVVAQQIPSRSRPTTGRSAGAHGIAEQASILYSRQEIAERLRQAWKHREQNKANIDIFLAHGMTVEERCDSELSMSTPPTPQPRREPDSMNEEKGLRNAEMPNNLVDRNKETSEIDKEDEEEHEKKSEVVSQIMENDSLIKEDESSTESAEKKKGKDEKMTDLHANTDIEKKTRININCTSLHLPANQSYSSFPSLRSENVGPAKTKNDDFSSAKQKRASFHSGSNRAFLVPMVDKSPKGPVEMKIAPVNKSVEIRCASADKTTVRSSIDRNTVLLARNSSVSLEKTKRTSSAPPQRRNIASAATRVQVNIVIDAPSLAHTTDKSIVCGRVQDEQSAVEKNEEAPTKISRSERSIKSAPLKRRSRSARRRFFASSNPNGCKDEDRGEGRGKSSMDPRTSDVVTMVSLVSSADSDSDIENSPGDDKLIDELRSKLPTTPIIKTSINPNPGTARKPIKSVSFQRDSFDEETSTSEEKQRIVNSVQPRFSLGVNVAHENGSGEDSIEQNLAIDGVVATPTTLPVVPTLLILNDTEKAIQPEAPLTDREKRCLAVPIGDLRDKKRKLLRMRSTPNRLLITEQTNNAPMEIKEQGSHLAIPQVDLVAVSVPSIDTSLPKMEQFSKKTLPAKEAPQEVILPSEPQFQTTKEKECWHLYRRMCDKGVCVSFDTVLRGMLTPTEYRLRQKELSQDLR